MKVPLSKPYVDKEMKDRVLEVIIPGSIFLETSAKILRKSLPSSSG